VPEYEKLADTWKPGEQPAREWAELAKQTGMKYMVMTTKHHEGFCLWDTKMTGYNAANNGPGRDLVAEFIEACREFDLRVGLYYSLMDWRHTDGAACARDMTARRRFLDFTQGAVRELCSNYGKIDILWYDVSWPLESPEQWESVKMNAMVRELQPDIIINNRSKLDEDFGTPEEQIAAEKAGREWEACMTFNGSWGYMPSAVDWHSAREVVSMLRSAAAGRGNLLLNIGPRPDGSVPEEAVSILGDVGQWTKVNGEAFYGQVDRADKMERMPCGQWTVKGNQAYFWCSRWPGHELVIGGVQTGVNRAYYLGTGEEIEFEQKENRLILKNLPEKNPDDIVGVTVIKLECDGPPIQKLGSGCVLLREP
jgi:alpha-L-fucosidase